MAASLLGLGLLLGGSAYAQDYSSRPASPTPGFQVSPNYDAPAPTGYPELDDGRGLFR